VRKLKEQQLNLMLFDGAQVKHSEIAGTLAADTLSYRNQHQNRGIGFTKSQYIEATMAFMEKGGVFNSHYDKVSLTHDMTNGSTQ